MVNESKAVFTLGIKVCLGWSVHKWSESDQERSVCFCMLI